MLGYFKKRWQHTWNDNGGLTLPGYRYCGPGNRMRGSPINGLDEACMRHDETPGYSYTQYENSDDTLIRDSEREFWSNPIESSIVWEVFNAKKALAKRKQNQEMVRRRTRRRVTRRRPYKGFRKRYNNIRRGRNKFYLRKGSRKRIHKGGYRRTFKRRFNRRKNSPLLRMLRIMNPPRSYKYFWVSEYKAGVNKHILLNPFAYYSFSTVLTANDSYNLFSRPGMQQVINNLYPGTSTDALILDGEQFWLFNRVQEVKIKVNSVAKVYAIVYYVQCRKNTTCSAVDAAIAEIPNKQMFSNANGNILPWGAGTDPITTGSGAQAVVYDGGSFSQGAQIANIHPIFTLREAENFRTTWKVYKTKKLEWDNQKQHVITMRSKKPFLFDKMKYTDNPVIDNTGTVTGGVRYTYKRGDKACFIRFYTDPLPSAASAQKCGYPNFDVAMEFRSYAQVALRTSQTRLHYNAPNFGNVAADPQIVEISETVVSAT